MDVKERLALKARKNSERRFNGEFEPRNRQCGMQIDASLDSAFFRAFSAGRSLSPFLDLADSA